MMEKDIIEKSVEILTVLTETQKTLSANITKLNDHFILHDAKQDSLRDEFIKVIKWVFIAMFGLLATMAGIEKLPNLF